MAYASHVLRGSSGDSALQILQGKIEGKLYQGRPRRMWLDDLKEWAQLETHTAIKRTAEDRSRWRLCTYMECQPTETEMTTDVDDEKLMITSSQLCV